MPSNINGTVPAFQSFAASAPVRTNFAHARDEITALQAEVLRLGNEITRLNGEITRLNTDLQRALTHYATAAPSSPVNGQIWFHSGTGVMSVWHAGAWYRIN